VDARRFLAARFPASLSNDFRLPGITQDKQAYIDYAKGDAVRRRFPTCGSSTASRRLTSGR